MTVRGNAGQRCQRLCQGEMRARRRQEQPEDAASAGRCNDDFRSEAKPGDANRRKPMRIGSIRRAMRFVELHDDLDRTIRENAFAARHKHALEIPNAMDAAVQSRSSGRRPTGLDPRPKP